MIIRNGKVFMEDFQFHPGTVLVQGKRIAAVSGSGKPEGEKAENSSHEVSLDAKGCLVLPGLVDIHLHGCAGCDFCDGEPESIAKIAEREALWGVTSLLSLIHI